MFFESFTGIPNPSCKGQESKKAVFFFSLRCGPGDIGFKVWYQADTDPKDLNFILRGCQRLD